MKLKSLKLVTALLCLSIMVACKGTKDAQTNKDKSKSCNHCSQTSCTPQCSSGK